MKGSPPLPIKWEYIDTGGHTVSEEIAKNAKYKTGELIPYEQNYKWGYKNKKGEIIINAKYGYAGRFSNGLALVQKSIKCGISTTKPGGYPEVKKGKWLFINKLGITVLKPKHYDRVYEFSEGLARVIIKDRQGVAYWGCINTKGSLVIKTIYKCMDSFHEGLALVCIETGTDTTFNEQVGYIDKKGSLTIKPQFDMGKEFSDGLVAVEVKDKWGYINKEGEYIVKPKFNDAGSFKEGLAPVKVKNKWGYIDKKGEFVIKPKFYEAGEFSNGLAPVGISTGDKRKMGYIDKKGKIIIKPSYVEAYTFENGYALVGTWLGR